MKKQGMSEEGVSIEAAVAAAQNAAAFYVHPHLGRLEIKGADRRDLLHRLSTNDLLSQTPPAVTDTIFLTDKGRIVDLVRVAIFPESLLLVTSPHRELKVKEWLSKYTIMEDIEMEQPSADAQLFSLFGPKLKSVLRNVFDDFKNDQPLATARLGSVEVILDAQTHHGNRWFNVQTPKGGSGHLREALLLAGVQELDAPSYEYYRIESGILSASELNESFNPFDVSLRSAISFSKGCYIGQEVIARLDTYQKIHKELVSLKLEQPIMPAVLPIDIFASSSKIGTITAVSERPFRGSFAGLAVMNANGLMPGNTVTLQYQPPETKAVISRFFR